MALGRHTLIPVAIMLVCQIPVYVGLCVSWKTLKGTPSPLQPPKSAQNGTLPSNDMEGIDDGDQDVEDAIEEKEDCRDVVEKPMHVSVL